jgi:splicing factor 3B subunit 4
MLDEPHANPLPINFARKILKRQSLQFSRSGRGEMSAGIDQRNQDATIYIGNLDEKVTDEMLWELMLQAGPVVNVHVPKDKVNNQHQGYGFVEFRSEEDADYAMKVMNMIKLYSQPIKCNKASQDKKTLDVGANVFVGNLDPEVDEKILYDTFNAFGGITQPPKIMRDPDTLISRGYGFVSFDTFEASDMAIECMNGQFLCNRPIMCQYAFKKESQGERHGSQAERMIASTLPQKYKPNVLFAGGESERAPAPSMVPPPGMPMPPMPSSFPMGMGAPPPMPNMSMGMGAPPPMPMMGFMPPPPFGGNMSYPPFPFPPPPPPM